MVDLSLCILLYLSFMLICVLNERGDRMKFKDIGKDKYFEIVGLEGYYKVDHNKREAKAYRKLSTGRMMYDGTVRGLYDNLEAGRWKIK